jgi:hypothetical protein
MVAGLFSLAYGFKHIKFEGQNNLNRAEQHTLLGPVLMKNILSFPVGEGLCYGPLADIHPKFSNDSSLRESGQSISANQLALPAAIHTLYFSFFRTTRYVRMTETINCYLEDCRRIINEADKASKVAAGINAAPCLSVHFRF